MNKITMTSGKEYMIEDVYATKEEIKGLMLQNNLLVIDDKTVIQTNKIESVKEFSLSDLK